MKFGRTHKRLNVVVIAILTVKQKHFCMTLTVKDA